MLIIVEGVCSSSIYCLSATIFLIFFFSDWADKQKVKDKLEEIKYFKMNDEPSKPGLSDQEVQEIQKHLADVPSHLIPSEIQKIEM